MEYWQELIAVDEIPLDDKGHHTVSYMEYHFRMPLPPDVIDEMRMIQSINDWLVSHLLNKQSMDVRIPQNMKQPVIVSFRDRDEAMKFKLGFTW